MVMKMKGPMASVSAAASFRGGSYANCDEGTIGAMNIEMEFLNRNGIPEQDFRIRLKLFRSSVCLQLVS
jgi:hypothetical protein